MSNSGLDAGDGKAEVCIFLFDVTVELRRYTGLVGYLHETTPD